MIPTNSLLNLDSSDLENQLRVVEDIQNEITTNIFGNDAYVLQKPLPDFCFKTWDLNTNKKVFVNICHLDVLPEPPRITEDTINLEEYRVPMSVGDLRYDMDLKGVEAAVIDIAFNTNFLQTATKDFFLDIVKVAIKEKYKMKLSDEVVVLKNKKSYGELGMHRIKKQVVDEHLGIIAKKESLIKDISNNFSERLSMTANEDHIMKTPEFRVFKQKSDSDTLVVEIKLPYVSSSKDFTLDVGEDRIILESKVGNYFLDTFFPCEINPDNTTAQFYKYSKILKIRMKVESSV